VNYSFRNRYLLTFTYRADGSSRFVGANRWGYFPSGAASWKVSEESFFKNWNPTWWDNATIRVGYGLTGNENIRGYYPYLTPISQGQFYVLGKDEVRVNGSAPGLGNPDVKWETVKQFNLGLDLSFLRGRLGLTADYYIKKTDDILLSQSIPRTSGFGSMTRNVGGVDNRGFELTVNWRETRGDFSYGISANASYYQNKVTNLGTTAALTSSFTYDYALIDLQPAIGNNIRSVVGRPLNEFYGYVTDGIFQSQAEIDSYVNSKGVKIQPDAKPGDFRFKDLDDNGSIGTADQDFIGHSQPDVVYGLALDARWKNLDINMLWQGVFGGDIYNAAKFYFHKFDGTANTRTSYIGSYWSETNKSGTQPALTHNSARNDRNYKNSDWYVEDGDFLRLREIQLGYNLTPNFGGGVRPAIRVYLAASNLFTITGYSGFEPEIGTDNSVDRGIYPQARTYRVGTVINF
jgi:TonB-linked SusC/RagA family outer membrane protein